MFRILFIVTLFFLSACTLPGTQTESTSNLLLVEHEDFSLQVPKNWTPNTQSNLPTPKIGSIALSYISPEVKYGFSNNLLVLTDALDMPVTSKKYSELNNVQTTKKYLEYTKLKNEAILFSDSDESMLYIFEARYNTATPRMKFLQTAKVCGTRVYLMHIALSLDKSADTYKDILKTFECR